MLTMHTKRLKVCLQLIFFDVIEPKLLAISKRKLNLDLWTYSDHSVRYEFVGKLAAMPIMDIPPDQVPAIK